MPSKRDEVIRHRYIDTSFNYHLAHYVAYLEGSDAAQSRTDRGLCGDDSQESQGVKPKAVGREHQAMEESTDECA